jgi:hypothetical protein
MGKVVTWKVVRPTTSTKNQVWGKPNAPKTHHSEYQKHKFNAFSVFRHTRNLVRVAVAACLWLTTFNNPIALCTLKPTAPKLEIWEAS